MTVTRVPSAALAPTDQPVHWWAGEDTLTWSKPITVIACGAETDRANHDANRVTCAECLEAVVRRRCLAIEDEPGPLPGRCGRTPNHEGPHEWELGRVVVPPTPQRMGILAQASESYAASAAREELQRRASEESQHADLVVWDEAQEFTAENRPSGRLPWPRIARWTA